MKHNFWCTLPCVLPEETNNVWIDTKGSPHDVSEMSEYFLTKTKEMLTRWVLQLEPEPDWDSMDVAFDFCNEAALPGFAKLIRASKLWLEVFEEELDNRKEGIVPTKRL